MMRRASIARRAAIAFACLLLAIALPFGGAALADDGGADSKAPASQQEASAVRAPGKPAPQGKAEGGATKAEAPADKAEKAVKAGPEKDEPVEAGEPPEAGKQAEREAPSAVSAKCAGAGRTIVAEGAAAAALAGLKVGDDATAAARALGLAGAATVRFSDGSEKEVAVAKWTVSSVKDGTYTLRAELAGEAGGLPEEELPSVTVEARSESTIARMLAENTQAHQRSVRAQKLAVQGAKSEGKFDGGPSYVGKPMKDPPPTMRTVLRGRCYIETGKDKDFVVNKFDGGLIRKAYFHCADPSAAAPNNVWADYYAVLVGVDLEKGIAKYKVCVVPPDAATGATNYVPELGKECLTGYQRLVGEAELPLVKLKLKKSSANPDITKGNKDYSLKGAIYCVYTDKACTNGVGFLTTDKDGNSVDNIVLFPGTYYVKEVIPPMGYELDKSVHKVVLESNGKPAEVVLKVEDEPLTRKLKLRKTSSNPAITDGNDNYSLEGAVYRVYTDKSCTKRAKNTKGKNFELVTDKNGVTGTAKLAAGTYYVKEYKAPKGFKLDKGVYAVDLRMIDQELAVADVPSMDPPDFFKFDADRARLDLGAGGQGDATVGSAEYTIEYHRSTDGSGEAVRTWVFCTDEQGYVNYDEEHLVSGSALYQNEKGNPSLPLGSIVVYESKAPKGYKVNPTRYVGRIGQAVEGGSAGFTWVNAPGGRVDDEVIRGGVEIDKRDVETIEGRDRGEAVLSAVFGIVNKSLDEVIVDGKAYKPGEEVGTITADPDTGVARSRADWLPYGTYYVYEKIEPKGCLPGPDGALFTFEIREEGKIVGYTPKGEKLVFTNEVIKGGISVEKSLVGGPASDLEGIGFAVYDSKGNRVTWKDADGNEVDAIYLDAQGRGSTPDDALPYGHYRIEEIAGTVPARVISLRDSAGAGSDFAGEVFVDKDGHVYVIEVVNYARPEVDVVKVDGDAYSAGSFERIQAPSTWVLERLEGGEWTVVAMAATGGGLAAFDRSAIDRFGVYRLREVSSPEQGSGDGWMMPEGAGQSAVLEFAVDAEGYGDFVTGVTAHSLAEDGHQLAFGTGEDGRARITATALNWRYRKIIPHKVDSETGKPVADTEFSLAVWTGRGKPAEMGGSDSSGAWREVGRAKTGKDGDHIFDGLVCGYYRLSETRPNPAYMAPEEGGTQGTFYMEVSTSNGKPQVQVVEDKPIHVMTTVDEWTIEKTSAGLAYKDARGRDVSNVGEEIYKYTVGFSNGKTNTYADEYYVIDRLEMTRAPYDMRVKVVITPVVKGDCDGYFYVLVKTARGKVGKNAGGMAFAQPELHPGSLCDGSQRFDAAGWRLLGRYSTAEAAKLDMSKILGKGDYVTGIALCYGAVEPGFGTVTKLTYYVEATHALTEGTVIPDSVQSHISRNWTTAVKHLMSGDRGANAYGSGLYDDADDEVKTVVLGTFDVETHSSLDGWSGGHGMTTGFPPMPQTGDAMAVAARGAAAAAAMALIALGVALAARRKQQ